ncbi:hypothetical protein [Arthrobacter sp. NEB 688]|uniref:hypothetical protein n=1 Tax=Arthrobacter sp. NEB 688 TaxID=904039 RepID=UPI001566FB78|nr:hypothetical protein [Arthrobacter sp. NEB 688]QKE83190.1 hypothetical protein HL663_03990 [Arthrobacter sp. NEB 688]
MNDQPSGHDPGRTPRDAGPPRPGAGRGPVRDLLASALVGIEARRRVDPAHVGRVRVTSATGGGPLVVHDDGVGFTPQEVRWLSATPPPVEHGTVREGLRRYETSLLSAFAVADVVELVTRSALVPMAPTMRWVGLPDGTVLVTLADEPLERPGTEIRLHPRRSTRSWCTPETVLEQVLDVIDQLPVAVEVDGVLVSGGATLWERPAHEQLEWCRQRLGVAPLAVLPLRASVSGLRAVAAVLPATETEAPVAHRRYVDGMLADEGPSALVPEWMSFCVVVVDDRRDALTDPAHDDPEVAERIGRALLAQLILLRATDPATQAGILEAHGPALARRALESRDLLDLVRSTVPLPTTLGPRTLDELAGHGSVLFTDDPQVLSAVHGAAVRDGVVVVDATREHVATLLDGLAAADASAPAVVRIRATVVDVFGAAS